MNFFPSAPALKLLVCASNAEWHILAKGSIFILWYEDQFVAKKKSEITSIRIGAILRTFFGNLLHADLITLFWLEIASTFRCNLIPRESSRSQESWIRPFEKSPSTAPANRPLTVDWGRWVSRACYELKPMSSLPRSAILVFTLRHGRLFVTSA